MEQNVSIAAPKQLVINQQNQIEFNAAVANQLGNRAKTVTTFMMSDLDAMGYKYASFTFGRKLDRKHCHDLYKALTRKGKTRFTKRAVVMSAKAVLVANQEVTPENRIKIFDLDAQELTLQTSEVEKYLVFLDGNHRWFVHCQHPEINLEVELAVTEDPFSFMADYNSLSNNWSLKDWLNANIATGRIETGIHNTTEEVEKLLGVSMKYASYLLSRVRECVKKSDLEAGKDSTTNNPDFVKRGMIIARTIAANFTKPGKGGSEMTKVLYRGVRTLQFLDAIEHTDKANPSTDFAPQFAACICNLSDDDLAALYRCFVEKDYKALNQNLAKIYSAFIKSHKDEMPALIEAAQNEIKQMLADSEEDKPKTLKSGTAKELIEAIQVEKDIEASNQAHKDYEKAESELKKAEKELLETQNKLDDASKKRKPYYEEKLKEAQKKVDQATEKLENAKKAVKMADDKIA